MKHKKGKYATGQAPANSTRLFDLGKSSAEKVEARKLESASLFEQPKRNFSNVKASRYPEYEPPLVINVIDLDFQDEPADYERFPLDGGGWDE